MSHACGPPTVPAESQARRPSVAARMQPAIAIPLRPSRRRAGIAWNNSWMNRNNRPATTTIVVQRNCIEAKASVPASRASHNAVLPSTSRTGLRASPAPPARSGYIPASWRKPRQHTLQSSVNQDSATRLGSRWFTGKTPNQGGTAPRAICVLLRGHCRGRHARRPRGLAHVGFDITRVVAVEDMPEQPAIEIGRAHQAIHDRERQIHVALHHDRLVVMCGMMTSDGVDERHMAHEPVLVDMTAEVPGL